MQLGKKAGMAPREFAISAGRFTAADGIDSVEVAGPGLINIRLGAGSRANSPALSSVRRAEYVVTRRSQGVPSTSSTWSANSTGLCTPGGARWAAVGDRLASPPVPPPREYYQRRLADDRFSHPLYACHGAARSLRTATAASTSLTSPTRSAPMRTPPVNPTRSLPEDEAISGARKRTKTRCA